MDKRRPCSQCKTGEFSCSKCRKWLRRIEWVYTKKLKKLRLKRFGLRQDLHNQIASLLVKYYGTILLPTFRTSEMLKSKLLSSTTKRRMQGLAHYQFQQKLIGLCNREGRKLYLVGEEYTTKTCGGCGELHSNIQGDKVFVCPNPECTYTMDRDIHGARNILIKTFSEHGAVSLLDNVDHICLSGQDEDETAATVTIRDSS